MEETTVAREDRSNAVFSISLADLRFNLEKKNTSKSKRAVGTDELRRVIAELEQEVPFSDSQFTQITTQIPPHYSPLPHINTESQTKDISPAYTEKPPIPEESAWTEGFNVRDTSELFEEEGAKGTEMIRVIGPRATTPELENTDISRSVSPVRIARLEDTNPPTPSHPLIETIYLPPSSVERSPEPEHHPPLPFHLEALREGGEVEPCPTSFPPKAKKPKRPKPTPTFETFQQMEIPPLTRPVQPEKVDIGLQPAPTLDTVGSATFETIHQMEIAPVPRPVKRPKAEKVDIGVQPVHRVLDIGGRATLEIKRVVSPVTEPKEDSVPSKPVEVKTRTSLQPLQSTTLSSLTTKATGSPRSEDNLDTRSHISTKRPNSATFSLPPESLFDLPVRHKGNHQLTSLEARESLSIPPSSLLHQTSLETLEYVAVPARAKAQLSLQSIGLEPLRGRKPLETCDIGIATQMQTSTDQVTETEVKVGMTSWTMSLYPPAKPALAFQSTLSDCIQPILPPTPVRNRRRRKIVPNPVIYRQETGENGALFQLTPTVGRMVKVKEYMVINEESSTKVSLPPLYSPEVVHAMSLQRGASHKGLPRAGISPFRAGESYRSKEQYYMRYRGLGSVGGRTISRDTLSESPEKAFRKTPKYMPKLL